MASINAILPVSDISLSQQELSCYRMIIFYFIQANSSGNGFTLMESILIFSWVIFVAPIIVLPTKNLEWAKAKAIADESSSYF